MKKTPAWKQPSNLFLAVIAVPAFLLILVFSPLYSLGFRFLCWAGWWKNSHSVGHFGPEITFSWTCSTSSEAELALSKSIDALLELISGSHPEINPQTLRFINPETGFCLSDQALSRIYPPFGSEVGGRLNDERIECGTLLINDTVELEAIDIDTRSPFAGHFSATLPTEISAKLLAETALRHGIRPPGS